MRHAVIDSSNSNTVINVIQLVDLTQWQHPPNCFVVPTDTGNIGDTWNGTNFIAPITQPPPPPLTADQLYDILINTRCLTRALIRALNDGSFPIGTNMTAAQIKTILKAKLNG
jgi:hypothetical protein